MMNSLTLLVFLLSVSFLNAQMVDTIYYDHDWKETREKDEFAFYRVHSLEKKDGVYEVRDYFISNQLQMKGQFSDAKHTQYAGNFIWYYANGKKERERNFVDGKRHGTSEEWYADGQKESYTVYDMGNQTGEFKSWYSNGQLKGMNKYNTASGKDSCYLWWENGQKRMTGTILGYLEQGIKYDQYWLESGEQTLVDGTGSMSYEEYGFTFSGPILNGYKSGKWKKKDANGKQTGEFIFKEGKFIKGYLTELGYKDKFTSWEREPKYAKGGGSGMSQFITSNLSNSCNDIIYNTVYVQYIVEKDGDLSHIKLRMGKVSDCQMASIESMLNSMPNWIPGIQAGHYVRVNYTIPIAYKER